MRSELALYSYTQENVVMTVLNQVSAYTEVMTRLDLLSRTSELARPFGI